MKSFRMQLLWVVSYAVLYIFVFDFEMLVIIMLAQLLYGVSDLHKKTE